MSGLEAPRDGGPAFPTGARLGDAMSIQGGMSLRDYFAAAIAPSLIQLSISHALAAGDDQDWKPWSKDEIASKAYAIADAMLAERAR